MAVIQFCVEEYVDGLWHRDPADCQTDLPPFQVKRWKIWSAQGWSYIGDLHGYRGAYEAFAQRLTAEFNKLAAALGDTIDVEASPLISYYNGPGTDTHPFLEDAIQRAGLPTRADVESHSFNEERPSGE